jgi:3-hydroxy-5-phosphonooxypentane-2,4-dione thiolase
MGFRFLSIWADDVCFRDNVREVLGRQDTKSAQHLFVRFVKTYFCEGFERVVETSPVPVVIAGGKKLPEKEALQLAYDAIKAGAVGVDMGRNIFQSENPVAMVQAVREIVHADATVNQAFDLYQTITDR